MGLDQTSSVFPGKRVVVGTLYGSRVNRVFGVTLQAKNDPLYHFSATAPHPGGLAYPDITGRSDNGGRGLLRLHYQWVPTLVRLTRGNLTRIVLSFWRHYDRVHHLP